jgi:hypothetical protein
MVPTTSPRHSTSIRIDDSSLSTGEWDRLRAVDAENTFFHSRAWIDTYARHHGGTPFYLVARADGAAVGALASVRFERRPFYYLESLPMGTYGGPLVDPGFPEAEAVRAALLDRFLAYERAARCLRVQCVLRRPTAITASRGFREGAVHILSLEGGFEGFWTRVFSNNRRNEVNRAMKRDVHTRIGATQAEVASYVPLHDDAHARWGLSPHPPDFFVDLAKLQDEGVLVFLAFHATKLLGAHFTFVSNDELIVWHGVTTREDSNKFFPSTMLIRAEAEEAARLGLRRMNLGGSGGRASIENFKRLVGGELDRTAEREHEAWPLALARTLRRRRPRAGAGAG